MGRVGRRVGRVGGLVVVLLGAVAALAGAQTVFTRDDAFDFQEAHVVEFDGDGGSIWALGATVEDSTDWRRFKFAINIHGLNGYEENQICGTVALQAQEATIDWTGTGEHYEGSISGSGVLSHDFQDTGVHHVLLKVRFEGNTTSPNPLNPIYCTSVTEYRVFPFDIAILPGLPVFATPGGDALIQLSNDTCTEKRPILMVEGIDPTNSTSAETYYTLSQPLIDTLYGQGYEVFFLNFHETTGDMRDNAGVLRAALDAVHALCPQSLIALVGMSQGGVICRYVLAQAEGVSEDHHVGLFVSYDSPQQGAHVNRGVQDWIKLADSTQAPIAALQAVLKTTAAKQLLGSSTYDPTHWFHDTFYIELNGLNGDGYPDKCYNVAISNGSMKATWDDWDLPEYLLTLELRFADHTFLLHDEKACELDVRSGSMQVNFAQRQYGTLFSKHGAILGLFEYDIWVGYILTMWFDPVYIPTISALDLQEPIELDTHGNITNEPPSPFDETFAQPAPLMRPRGLPHNAVSTESQARLLEWLGRTARCVVSYCMPEGGAIPPDTCQLPILGGVVDVQPRNINVGGRDVAYSLARWDDGSTENPRRIYAPRGCDRSVVMKAHLAGTSSGATWANGQRKIVEAADAVGSTHHVAYESDGSIWYARNRRGAGWDYERLISGYESGASAPSLTTRYWGHEDQIQVYVAWLGSGSLMYRWSDADNGVTWNPPVEIPAVDPQAPLLPDEYCLLWAEGPIAGGGIYYQKQPQVFHSGNAHCVPGTEGSVLDPAVCVAGSCEYALAFVRDGKVWVEGFLDPNRANELAAPQVCMNMVDLTTAGWVAARPSVVSDGTRLFVAWEESSGSQHRVVFRQRAAGVWSAPVYFTHLDHIPTKPTMGIDWSSGKLHLVWQCGEHIALATRSCAGGSWSVVHDLGSGRSPCVVPSATTTPEAMWVSGDEAPYSLVISTCADMVPPGAVSDLTCSLGRTSAAVSWTAPGDDGFNGTAMTYDLRYSLNPITTEGAFAGATPVETWAPSEAGTPECAELWGLTRCRYYYFALKTQDTAGNWSGISNVASGMTLCSAYQEVLCLGDGLFVQGGLGGEWLLEGSVLGQDAEESAAIVAGTTSSEAEDATVRVYEPNEVSSAADLLAGVAVATDTCALEVPAAADSGRLAVRLSPKGQSAWELSGVKIVGVGHSVEEQVVLAGESALVGTLHALDAVMDSSGSDLTAALASGQDDVTVQVGSTWDMSVSGVDAGGAALVLEVVGRGAEDGDDARGITILAEDGAEGWRALTTLVPRDGKNRLVVDSLPGGHLRLLFHDECTVERLAWLGSCRRVSPEELDLVRAEHSEAGSVLPADKGEADLDVTLGPGENLVLTYDVPAVQADHTRDFFLVVRGRQEESERPAVALSAAAATPRPLVALPAAFALHQNQPNPFSGTTTVRFDLPVASKVDVSIFDLQGRRIRTLASGDFAAGFQSVVWDHRDDAGNSMRPSVYLCRLVAGTFRAQRTVVLLP